MQLQLFEMEKDNRVEQLRNFIRKQLVNNRFWFPTARQIVEIGDNFGVTGSKPWKIFVEEANHYCYRLGELEDHVDEDEAEEYSDIVTFYRKRLKIK